MDSLTEAPVATGRGLSLATNMTGAANGHSEPLFNDTVLVPLIPEHMSTNALAALGVTSCLWDIGNATNCSWTNRTVVNDSLSFSDLQPAEQQPEKVYWALMLVILPFLAVFGNILIILSVYKERGLQTATNYFIVSLAFADLLVAAAVMPFAVYVLEMTETDHGRSGQASIREERIASR